MELDLGSPHAEQFEVAEILPAPSADLAHHEKLGFEDNHIADGPDEVLTEKVHITGLDDLSTDQIKQFILEHHPLAGQLHVEWIDDHAANIRLSTASDAKILLAQLTCEEVSLETTRSTELRAAKKSGYFPHLRLRVRQARASDKKKPRAREASRYYLLHPEHDPGEGARRGPRRRHASPQTSAQFSRSQGLNYNDGEFSASMYDDDSAAPPTKNFREDDRGNTPSLSRSERILRTRTHPRSRTRSPSNADRASKSYRRRSSQDPEVTLMASNRIEQHNHGKELFPLRENFGQSCPASEAKASRLIGGLFSDTNEDSHDPPRLGEFVTGVSSHTFLGRFAPTLAERISAPDSNATTRHHGNIQTDKASVSNTDGASLGIGIRGMANDDRASSGESRIRPRELFPSKVTRNTGKELFTGRELRGAAEA